MPPARDASKEERILQVLREIGLGNAVELDVARGDLAVTELAHDFEDLGPGGVHALVDLLVHLDGHDELELLGGHFAFFGGLAVIAATAARPAAALEARRLAALADTAFRAGIPDLVGGLLAAVEPRAPVGVAESAVGTLPLPSIRLGRRRFPGLSFQLMIHRPPLTQYRNTAGGP